MIKATLGFALLAVEAEEHDGASDIDVDDVAAADAEAFFTNGRLMTKGRDA